MTLIDADVFLQYLIFSKRIDSLKCREVKEAVEMSKVDVFNKIRAEIEQLPTKTRTNWDGCCPDIDYPEIEYVDVTKKQLLEIIDKHKGERNEMPVSDKSNS